jgi:PQQ-dependent dehydrogenase (methanol/ethanol family)
MPRQPLPGTRTFALPSTTPLIVCMALLACDPAKTAPKVESKALALPSAARDAALAFVSNEDSGDISVLDLKQQRVVHTIPVGKRPRGLRLSHDGRVLYVAVSGSPKAPPGSDESKLPPPDRAEDGIALIDIDSGRRLRTLPSGPDPESFDLSPDGKLLYVSNEDAAALSVLDLSSGVLRQRVQVGGEPEGVTTCPDGSCVCVTSEQDGTVDIVDTSSLRVRARVDTGARPRSLLFSPDGKRAFVTNELGASVSAIDVAAGRVLGSVDLGGPPARPMGLAQSRDGSTLYASLGRGGGVAVIDTASLRATRTIAGVGKRPWGIALDPGGRLLYTANGPSNDVAVIDLERGSVTARIPVGRSPWGIVVREAQDPSPEPLFSPREPSALEKLSHDDTQWVMAGKNYENTRFSALDDITPDNVRDLRVAFSYATGISRGHEAAPLVIGRRMVLTTPFPNRVIALDLSASPVRVAWIYDPEANRAAQGVACCDVVNRGAAYAEGKIVFNTLDNHTIALDLATGEEVWRTKLGDINRGETMTMAPLIVRDKVLVGNSGGELGVRGWLSALELETGQLAYRAYSTGSDHDVRIGAEFRPFYAMDRGVDLGIHSWPPGKWQQGGGTVWGFLSYDVERDLLFYGTGNPGPWNPEQREGDNKWTCGVFARRPDTGEARWFYQWSPHDLHDYDGINENILVTLPIDGKQRTGYVYVLDRARGQVLSATPFVPITTSRGVDLESGRLNMVNERSTGVGRITRNICPASPGGKDWQPAAYSSETGLLYIPANNMCEDAQGYEANYIAGTPYVGMHTRMYAGPGGHRGELIGWDVQRKEARFRLPEAFPVWSGVLVTHAKLVFYGTMDGWFKAVHAETGKELWKQKLHSGVIGQPVTYRGPDGKQYVAVFAGVGGWAGAVVSGDLDPNDTTAALGFVGAMGDLPAHTKKGGILYTFGLP